MFLCVCVCVLDLRRCCLCVSVDPRWSQNSTEHISPLGVFTHTFRHTQIFRVILLTVGSPEPLLAPLLQDFCSTGTVKWIPMEARRGPLSLLCLSPLQDRKEWEKNQLPGWVWVPAESEWAQVSLSFVCKFEQRGRETEEVGKESYRSTT